jgi:hypothetical protein
MRQPPHTNPSSANFTSPSKLNLPSSGFASPFGFWFAAASSWTTGPPHLTVEFFERDELAQSIHREAGQAQRATTACRTVRAGVKAPSGKAPNHNPTLPLILEVDSSVARIGVDSSTWARIGETVLFAVAQYWRLDAIDRTLAELSDWARRDLETNTSFARILGRKRTRDLRACRRALQKLILDLPDFEGALTNPGGYLPSARAVALYRRLSIWLGLIRRRREIDERIEVVESIFDSLADSLNHSQSLAFQIALELAIVALLLIDVSIYFWDAFF